MPTTRGTNFYLADPNLAFVCSTVMTAEDLTRARKRLVGALYVKKWLRPPAPPASVFAARECGWLDGSVDWAPIPADALSAVTAGHP